MTRLRGLVRLAAHFLFPSAVLGPVDLPPCILQRPLGSALHWHSVPRRVLASHRSPFKGLSRARLFAADIRATASR